jgi:hypothetical protein
MITKERLVALFTILEVPYSIKHGELSKSGLNATAIHAADYGDAAYDQIIAYLEDLILDEEIKTKLETLLDCWISLGVDAIAVRSVSDVGDMDYSTEGERAEIRRQVLILVPFYRRHEELLRASNRGLFVTKVP